MLSLRRSDASIVVFGSSMYCFAEVIAMSASRFASRAFAASCSHDVIAAARGVPLMLPFAYKYPNVPHNINAPMMIVIHGRRRRRFTERRC